MLWPSLFRNAVLLIMLPDPDPRSKSVIPNSSLHKDLCPKGAAAVLRVAWSIRRSTLVVLLGVLDHMIYVFLSMR